MSRTSGTNDREPSIAIIGAGPGGLCIGIRLAGAGFERFEILEKAGGVGGTGYHNRYPGCACDVPSQLYSFSFEIKHDWSRPFAPQAEILAYLERELEAFEMWQVGCTDYYRAPSGRIVTQWPRSMPALEQVLASLDEDCYEVAERAPAGAAGELREAARAGRRRQIGGS